MNSDSDRRQRGLRGTRLSARRVTNVQSFQHTITSVRPAVSRRHRYWAKQCPTCEEIPRLQRFCPDCRDRGCDQRGLPISMARIGTNSGNAMLERLNQERDLMAEEQAAEIKRQYLERYTRVCPGCDALSFIPDDDYICQGCRSEGC